MTAATGTTVSAPTTDIAPVLGGRRIAVDARYARRPGMGIHGYLHQVVRLLVAAGAEVTLLTNFPTEQWRNDFPSASWLSFGSRRAIVWEQVDLPRVLRAQRFDAYWAPANTGIPWARVGRTTTIFTLHDLIPLRLWRQYLLPRPLLALPYLVWTSAGVVRSSHILTVSHASARDLRRLTGRRASVAAPMWFADVVPTSDAGGADRDAHADADEVLLRDAGVHPGRYVLYNGGHDPRKNVPQLLRGIAAIAPSHPDLCLVLMGRGYDRFERLSRELGIADRVRMTGFVDDATKWALLRRAAVLAYPSTYEGFGLPLVEAFAAGTPVVTSDNSSLAEVAGGAAVLVDPHDPADIGAGIESALNTTTAQQLVHGGHERLHAFQPDLIRADVLAFLQDALGDPS